MVVWARATGHKPTTTCATPPSMANWIGRTSSARHGQLDRAALREARSLIWQFRTWEKDKAAFGCCKLDWRPHGPSREWPQATNGSDAAEHACHLTTVLGTLVTWKRRDGLTKGDNTKQLHEKGLLDVVHNPAATRPVSSQLTGGILCKLALDVPDEPRPSLDSTWRGSQSLIETDRRRPEA